MNKTSGVIEKKELALKEIITKRNQYGLFSNISFILKFAWNRRRSVIIFSFLIAVCTVLLGLVQLFVVPTLLGAVEEEVPLNTLFLLIFLFTASLMFLGAARAYLDSCAQFGRIEIRLALGELIQNKSLTMSYPDVENQDVRKKWIRLLCLSPVIRLQQKPFGPL